LLGPRHPLADLAAEHDQIDRGFARDATGDLLLDGGEHDHQLGALGAQRGRFTLRRRDGILGLAA
jgi:hypothetical protein